MTENFMRHLIAFCGMLICGLAYFSGYWSSNHGWWWTAFGLIVIYLAIYKYMDYHH